MNHERGKLKAILFSHYEEKRKKKSKDKPIRNKTKIIAQTNPHRKDR